MSGPDRDGSSARSPQSLHASCVVLDGAGLLILGASGSGKSTLALALMAHGAALVADERVQVLRQGEALLARPPAALAGLIEARGVGLLEVPYVVEVPLAAVVDLDRAEEMRLPPLRFWTHDGVAVPLVLGRDHPALAPALLALLRGSRRAVDGVARTVAGPHHDLHS
ncbi:MAG: HPr kinase/phosphatase C-terminal domain-containing protein [Pseudomonadota bacterium]